MTNFKYTLIDVYGNAGWDESQMVDVTIVQRVMGTLSLIGSMYVIQEVLRNEQKRNHTFHRLMVGLSVADALTSLFAHILSTALIPKGYQVLAVGNVATCDVQGFISWMCACVTALYNCSLATYYLVQLKYNWINRRIKALEKWLHIVPWSVGLVHAIAALAFKSYGPFGFSCTVTRYTYPIECTFADSSVECIRGNYPIVTIFLGAFMYITIFLAIGYISVTMYMVYKSVSKIEIQAHRYSFASYRSKVTDRKRSRRVMVQGALYSLALILTYIFAVIIIVAGGTINSYVLHILLYSFWPLQGFFNALIYMIPLFQRVGRRMSDKRLERKIELLILKKSKDEEDENSKRYGIFGVLPLSNSKRNDNKNGKIVKYNDHNNQSALKIDEVIEEKGGSKEFDREEVKEEIRQRSKTTITISGLIDDQFKSKEKVEFKVTDNIENNSDYHHDDSNVCEEVIEEEAQERGESGISHHSGKDVSRQSEENFDDGDDGDNNYESDCNDVDDYIALSSRRL